MMNKKIFGNSKLKSKNKHLKISTITFVFVFIKRLKKSQKRSKHRAFILNQWLNTEYAYHRDLQMCQRLIRKRMLDQFNIISADKANVLFPQIENMIQLSEMMIAVLEGAKQKSNPNEIKIGKQLNFFANGYKVYGTYFGNHSRIQNILNQLTQHHEHRMKDIQSDLRKQMKKYDKNKQSITIKDCMQQPLYRLFKYVLFMKDYIKKLTTLHPDFEAVNEAMKAFHDINNSNNDLMKKLEQQEKTIKLNRLFGGILKQTRTFIAEMHADTIYSTGKIYIFNDLVIISRIQSTLGTAREEKQKNIELNQFSYVQQQSDMKYFKNILILIGKEECVHLLFVEQGSRFEVLKCLTKTIKELRVRSEQRKKLEIMHKNQTQNKAKITFTLKANQNSEKQFKFEPEFRVEILGFQVRPITALSNDTVYITRFMIPIYFEDEVARYEMQKDQNKKKFKVRKMNSLPFLEDKYDEQEEFEEAGIKKNPHKEINQRIEIHFSQLQTIYNMMIPKCSDKLPNIDPLTKQVNIYSKGKKKTKLFQMRKFFIEQFFNFVFRHEQLLISPIWFIQKLRINPQLWDYVTQRNNQIYNTQPGNKKSYGPNHCNSCKKTQIKSIQEFQHYRGYFLGDGNHLSNRSEDRYCFNFFNLLRMHLLQFSYICFGTLERILLYYHYSQGRLDYPFLIHRFTNKDIKRALRIYLTSAQEDFLTVTFTEKSTVGQIIDEIGMSFDMKVCFDYDLITTFNGRRRILDRDEFIIDAINTLNLKCVETEQKNQTQQKSLFGAIKKWGHQVFAKDADEANKIFFSKTVYLHKSLEIKSLQNKKKKKLQIQNIYWAIKEGLIKLNDQEFIQLAAYYYCLKEVDSLAHFSLEKLNKKTLSRIVPSDKTQAFECYAQMSRQIAIAVERQKSSILKHRSTDHIMNKILELIWKNKDYYTYYIQADARQIPTSICKVSPGNCLIGVNYKNIIITKNENTTSPIILLALQDIVYYTSVFSIFITHHEIGNFRLDTKMVYHFGQVLNKYKQISKRFPQHKA